MAILLRHFFLKGVTILAAVRLLLSKRRATTSILEMEKILAPAGVQLKHLRLDRPSHEGVIDRLRGDTSPLIVLGKFSSCC